MERIGDSLTRRIGAKLSNAMSFSGRITRSDFFVWSIGLSLIAGIAKLPFGGMEWERGWFAEAAVDLLFCLPMFAVVVRRLHDWSRSGWWALLLLPLPFWGLYRSYRAYFAALNPDWQNQSDPLAFVWWWLAPSIILGLAIWLVPGTRGANRFGPDPRGETQANNPRVADSTSA